MGKIAAINLYLYDCSLESSLFSKLFIFSSFWDRWHKAHTKKCFYYITKRSSIFGNHVSKSFLFRVLVRRSIHAEQKKKKIKQKPKMSGTWRYGGVVFTWTLTLLRLDRHTRVHLTMSGRYNSLGNPGCTERGVLASRQSILLSLVCGETVEILLHGLSFLKERENSRERTSGEKANVYHDLHYLPRVRSKCSLLLSKALLTLCFQVQGKKN